MAEKKRVPGLEGSGVRVFGALAERMLITARIGAVQSVEGELTVDGSHVICLVPEGKRATSDWQDVLIHTSRFALIARLK